MLNLRILSPKFRLQVAELHVYLIVPSKYMYIHFNLKSLWNFVFKFQLFLVNYNNRKTTDTCFPKFRNFLRNFNKLTDSLIVHQFSVCDLQAATEIFHNPILRFQYSSAVHSGHFSSLIFYTQMHHTNKPCPESSYSKILYDINTSQL